MKTTKILGTSYIENLSNKFQYLFTEIDDKQPIKLFGAEVSEGWKNLLDGLLVKLITLDPSHTVRILQIKEKFGGLRFYVNGANEQIHELISEYEDNSLYICEVCGEPGTLHVTGHWYQTRCSKHKGDSRPVE
jgi:hypothetical protein